MPEAITKKIPVRIGEQMPCTPDVLERCPLIDISGAEENFYAVLAMNPQFWAIHSGKLDEGYIPIVSITFLDIETGDIHSSFLALPTRETDMPSSEVLDKILDSIQGHINKDIDEAVKNFKNMLQGGKHSRQIIVILNKNETFF